MVHAADSLIWLTLRYGDPYIPEILVTGRSARKHLLKWLPILLRFIVGVISRSANFVLYFVCIMIIINCIVFGYTLHV